MVILEIKGGTGAKDGGRCTRLQQSRIQCDFCFRDSLLSVWSMNETPVELQSLHFLHSTTGPTALSSQHRRVEE